MNQTTSLTVLRVMDPFSDARTKYGNWFRLFILLEEGVETVYKNILNKVGVTDVENGKEMYQKLYIYESKIRKLPPYYQKILLPDNKLIDTTQFDLRLKLFVMEIFDEQFPRKLRALGNRLYHIRKRDMKDQQFKFYWFEISNLLTDLGVDMNSFSGLRTVGQSSEMIKIQTEDMIFCIEGRIKVTLVLFLLFLFFLLYINPESE